MLTKQFNYAIKDVDAKKGIVTGYFASFDTKDSDGDIITKGAFTKTIQENGPKSSKPRIKHLLDHDRTKAVGVLQVLKEDNYGLYYESKAGSWGNGADFLKMCEDGLITEHSIGYRTVKEETTRDANYLKELALKEGSSLQCWGANSATPLLGIKSEEDLLEYAKILEKAISKGTYTDEAFIKLEFQLKSISELIASKRTIEPKIITQSDDEKAINYLLTIKKALN